MRRVFHLLLGVGKVLLNMLDWSNILPHGALDVDFLVMIHLPNNQET